MKLELQFTAERETKGAWRFEEALESQFSEPKVGSLYVRKATLGELGYREGDRLIVTVEVMP